MTRYEKLLRKKDDVVDKARKCYSGGFYFYAGLYSEMAKSYEKIMAAMTIGEAENAG